MDKPSDIPRSDRRRFPRYPCTGTASILQNGRRCGWGKANEISRGGCYIETFDPLPIGSEAQLQLTVAGIVLEICAKVAFATPLVGMGMEFVGVQTEQGNKIAQILDKIAPKVLLPAALRAGNDLEEAQSHMRTALRYLEQAKAELREAMPDSAGHRAKALQWTENAIQEATQGMEAAQLRPETMKPASTEHGAAWR